MHIQCRWHGRLFLLSSEPVLIGVGFYYFGCKRAWPGGSKTFYSSRHKRNNFLPRWTFKHERNFSQWSRWRRREVNVIMDLLWGDESNSNEQDLVIGVNDRSALTALLLSFVYFGAKFEFIYRRFGEAIKLRKTKVPISFWEKNYDSIRRNSCPSIQLFVRLNGFIRRANIVKLSY